MSKVVTIRVENTTLLTESMEVFVVEDTETTYPSEVEEFLVDHVGGRPNDRK